MIYLKTDEEIGLLRENNILVSQALAEVGRHIKPGVTTKQLDKIAEDFIRSHGAIPAFLGYQGYPASACISVNDQVVHGIPSDKVVIKEGDIVQEESRNSWTYVTSHLCERAADQKVILAQEFDFFVRL